MDTWHIFGASLLLLFELQLLQQKLGWLWSGSPTFGCVSVPGLLSSILLQSPLFTIYSAKQVKQILSLQMSCQCLCNSHSCSIIIGIWCQMLGFLRQTAFWQGRVWSGSGKPVCVEVAMIASIITCIDLLWRSREARPQQLGKNRDGKHFHADPIVNTKWP